MSIKALSVDNDFTLEDAFRSLHLGSAGEKIKVKYMTEIIDNVYERAKATAPIESGKLKGAIYKRITNGRYLIRGEVAIPSSIPYGAAVIYGDKRHTPNRFLEIALQDGFKEIQQKYDQILQSAIDEGMRE